MSVTRNGQRRKTLTLLQVLPFYMHPHLLGPGSRIAVLPPVISFVGSAGSGIDSQNAQSGLFHDFDDIATNKWSERPVCEYQYHNCDCLGTQLLWSSQAPSSP